MDGIVALFDDPADESCTNSLYEPFLVETKAVNFSERFDIHGIVADCQTAMRYVIVRALAEWILRLQDIRHRDRDRRQPQVSSTGRHSAINKRGLLTTWDRARP